MVVYVAVHPALKNSIFHTQTTLVFRSFIQAGARVCFGDELLDASPDVSDKLIVYGGLEGEALLDKAYVFQPENRWLYVVDEQASNDPSPYSRVLPYVKYVLRTKNVIVTYQNAGHLALLEGAGINMLVLPQCIEHIRPRVQKTGDILVSGQLDPVFYGMPDRPFYVTRTKVALTLRNEWSNRATLLQYPGTETSEALHARIGEGYLKTLDAFKLGVVCRGGTHDRFVGKYVEMGACHVLPVGDCPSYMPEAMKHAMVNVEGMSDEQTLKELDRLLKSPEEIERRSDAFTEETRKRYLSFLNVRRLLDEMCQ